MVNNVAKQYKYPDPMAYLGNAFQVGFMMAEANSVIAMRTLGMMGIWSVTPSEDGRMISEKVHALTKSHAAATRVALQGGTPELSTAVSI